MMLVTPGSCGSAPKEYVAIGNSGQISNAFSTGLSGVQKVADLGFVVMRKQHIAIVGIHAPG